MSKCCDPRAPRIFKIKLDTGLVGISGLDLIISEVRSLGPLSEEEIKSELLKRAAATNYIPGSASASYAEALYREYLQKLNDDQGHGG